MTGGARPALELTIVPYHADPRTLEEAIGAAVQTDSTSHVGE